MSIREPFWLIVGLLLVWAALMFITIGIVLTNDSFDQRIQAIEAQTAALAVQTAAIEERMTTIEAQQVPGVRVDYQKAGGMVCPVGNNVYRSAVGVYGGAEIFCLPQGIAPPTGAVQIGTIPGEGE